MPRITVMQTGMQRSSRRWSCIHAFCFVTFRRHVRWRGCVSWQTVWRAWTANRSIWGLGSLYRTRGIHLRCLRATIGRTGVGAWHSWMSQWRCSISARLNDWSENRWMDQFQGRNRVLRSWCWYSTKKSAAKSVNNKITFYSSNYEYGSRHPTTSTIRENALFKASGMREIYSPYLQECELHQTLAIKCCHSLCKNKQQQWMIHCEQHALLFTLTVLTVVRQQYE